MCASRMEVDVEGNIKDVVVSPAWGTLEGWLQALSSGGRFGRRDVTSTLGCGRKSTLD